MRIGRGLAELGVDSEAKWEALQALIVDDPHWQQWIHHLTEHHQIDAGSEGNAEMSSTDNHGS